MKLNAKWRTIIAVVSLLAAPATALALIGSKELDVEMRAKTSCFRYNVPSTATPDAGGNIVNGAVGVISRAIVGGGDAAISQTFTITDTCGGDGGTCLHTMSAPTRVGYILRDETAIGGAGTLVCTNVSITGKDAIGMPRTECVSGCTNAVLTAPSETEALTQAPFSKLSSVTFTGCTGAVTPLDDLLIYQTRYVGLEGLLRVDADVESACLSDSSGSNATTCASQTNIDTAVVKVARDRAYIDILTSSLFGVTPAANDEICIRIRPSWPGLQ